jgi:hypothetical protein
MNDKLSNNIFNLFIKTHLDYLSKKSSTRLISTISIYIYLYLKEKHYQK